MKRSTFLLAATLLGTACTSHSSSPGDVTLFWAFQDSLGKSSGQPGDNNGCGVAGVDTVDVTIDGNTQSFNCTGPNAAGITLQTFAPGAYPFTVVGFRNNTEQVFSASDTVNVLSATTVSKDVVLQALSPQSFDIFYNPTVPTTGTTPSVCVFNGTVVSGIVFRLEDLNGNVVATTEFPLPNGVTGQRPVACDPASFGIATQPLALGNYRLRYLQAVDATFTSLAEVCALSVSHTGFPIVVPLAAPTGAPCL